MNQIINRLKQQAGIDFNPDQEGLDLFLKLIIEECSEQIMNWRKEPFPFSEETAVWIIKSHFDIKS